MIAVSIIFCTYTTGINAMSLLQNTKTNGGQTLANRCYNQIDNKVSNRTRKRTKNQGGFARAGLAHPLISPYFLNPNAETKATPKREKAGDHSPAGFSLMCSMISSMLQSRASQILSSTLIATYSFFAMVLTVEDDRPVSSRSLVLFIPLSINSFQRRL